MRPRSLLLLPLPLVLTFALHAELGPARRLLPPSHGVLSFRDADRPAQTDGTNFLVVLHTLPTPSDVESLRQALLVRPDGTQLTQPFVLRRGFFSAGWAGHYLLLNGYTFQRLTSAGVLLDPEPRAMTPLGTPRFGVAATTSYLIVDTGNFGLLLHPNGDSTVLENLPSGQIVTIASNGPDYAITYKRNTVDSWVRVINDRGETLHDRELGYGKWVGSDRTSYLVNPDVYDHTLPYRILDRNLNVTRTIERSFGQQFRAMPGFGRGYWTDAGIPPWTGKVMVTELRAPSYLSETTVLDLANGTSSLFGYTFEGNPHGLFVLKGFYNGGYGLTTAHAIANVAELDDPPPPLKFRGALNRERPTAATNADGVSLVVWHESPDFQGRVYAARVSPGGALLDDAALPIASTNCGDVRTSVASDGTDFLVGWSGCTEVGAAVVSSRGLVTPSFTRPRAGVGFNHAASVIWDGQSYVYAWSVSNSTALARVLPSGAATLPPFSIDARNAVLAPLPNGELMSVHQGQNSEDLFAQRITPELRAAGGGFFVTPAAVPRTLTRMGDRLLITAHAYDGAAYAIGLDFQGHVVGAKTRLLGARDTRVQCADACAIVWKKPATSTEPATIVGVPVQVTYDVLLGGEVAVARYEKDHPTGEPVLVRGPLAQPALVLYTAPDPLDGGLQLFARTSLQKRRAVRMR